MTKKQKALSDALETLADDLPPQMAMIMAMSRGFVSAMDDTDIDNLVNNFRTIINKVEAAELA